MATKEEFRTQCDKVCEEIQKLHEMPLDGHTWQQKAEILEEASQDCDSCESMEEFLNWGEHFLPK